MPSKEKFGGSKQFRLETKRKNMALRSLISIARAFDRALRTSSEAVDRHMCTVFLENPARWSNAVDRFSKHGK